MTLQEKLAAKEEKQAKEAKYTFALVDGKQEQVTAGARRATHLSSAALCCAPFTDHILAVTTAEESCASWSPPLQPQIATMLPFKAKLATIS